jgi:hypothetical protein
MNERSETRSGASYFCKFALIADQKSPGRPVFKWGAGLMMAYLVGKIADFSFPGLSQLLFREFTEILEVAKGKPQGQVNGH